MHRVINADCLTITEKADCVFADPFDNIGLKYSSYKDTLPDREYAALLRKWVQHFSHLAPIVWLSFNAKWTFEMGEVFNAFLHNHLDWEGKACVQTFTFGQHNNHDLGNNHRPLWRLKHKDAQLYPEQIKVPSWRQLNGDKRAKPGGRVPGDHFDFPRVTGNSKQRRKWHPTQLNEGLVERCVLLSTKEGDHVLDPFGGTGTTLRVCKRINRKCTLVELDPLYCKKIGEEHGIKIHRRRAA